MNNSIEHYEAEMKEVMDMWSDKIDGLYLKIISIFIALSVATIGFAASYMLNNGYHTGKYETLISHVPLSLMLIGIFCLIVSCVCGLTYLLGRLYFIMNIVDYYTNQYRKAVSMEYEKSIGKRSDKEKNDGSHKPPSPKCWAIHIQCFFYGMFSMIVWVLFDFFSK